MPSIPPFTPGDCSRFAVCSMIGARCSLLGARCSSARVARSYSPHGYSSPAKTRKNRVQEVKQGRLPVVIRVMRRGGDGDVDEEEVGCCWKRG